MNQYKIDFNNTKLHIYNWDCQNPKAIIQIVQGVNEHGLRYNELGEFLSSKGYLVYTHDTVSQGQSRLESEETVYFCKNGLSVLTDAIIHVYNHITEAHKDLPVYAIGHSLGAGLLRYVIGTEAKLYDRVVLNGTAYQDPKPIQKGIMIGNLIKLFGKKKSSKMFNDIFRETQYKLRDYVEMDHFIEWLTRDKDYTELNKKDEYLYINLSVAAFVDMFKLFKAINTESHINATHTNTKILLLSGTHDPSTDFSAGTMDLYQKYTDLTQVDISYRLYTEGRHDTFQETNRQDVFKDINYFFEE